MPLRYNAKNINIFCKSVIFFFLSSVFMAACTKFVSIDPPASSITGSVVYSNNSSAAAVMTGVYINMIQDPNMSSGNKGLSFLEGLASDELQLYSTSKHYVPFYQNALSSATAGVSNSYFWTEIFQEIGVANSVINGLAGSPGVTPSMNKQLDGEAKFIRAFYNFYAVNLYGDIPLVTTTNYQTNSFIKRTPKSEVYFQIIKDLTDAKSELNNDFVDQSGVITTERTRPNKGAAHALLSRVYLYNGDWTQAESEADSVIANTTNFTLMTDLSKVFLMNSAESIWQLPSIDPGQNTWDAQYFVIYGAPPPDGGPVTLSNNLLNAFEPNDSRYINWVGTYTDDSITFYHFPFKYKDYVYGDPVTEYTTVFRLAEQYLIRAEARAHQNNISGAQDDLNAIRTRAGLANTNANDPASLLTAIIHERQVELFTEWGHRWFDLIRTGNINSVMGAPGNVCQMKGGTWSANDTLTPLPLSELQLNSNLTQNKGY